MLHQVFAPDPAVSGVLRRQKLPEDCALRWSRFVVPFEHREERFLYHTLTKQCFRTEGALCAGAKAGEGLDLSPGRLGEEGKTLAENWFLVPGDKDETALYEGLLRLLRLRGAKKHYTSYTILPTTACNARCFYCVGKDFRVVTMSEETVEQTISFLLRSRDPDKRIHLQWFGGEPLLAARIIDRISAGLTEAGIDFTASMITNGILIDEEIVSRMTGPWRIRFLQVSLDGEEKEYNRRKNYCHPYPSAFRTLLEALRLLADTGLPVVLRCNVDGDNADGLCHLVDELAQALPKKERIYPYFAPLYAERGTQRHADLFSRCLEAKRYAREKGFRYCPESSLHRLQAFFCMADDACGSTVIDAEGILFACDRLVPGTSYGNVREGVTRPDYLNSFLLPEPVSARCRDCAMLPLCTGFTRCPIKWAQCRQVRELILLSDLRCELDGLVPEDPEGDGMPEPIC